MRAIYYSLDLEHGKEVVLVTGEAAHHLNVVRVKTNETILLLNGKGAVIHGHILSVKKNEVEIKIQRADSFPPKHELSLAIANPKKDAFEDILKLAVELGIRNIYPLSSEFSQYEYAPSDRIQRVLESALIQSNNPFFPVIHPQQPLVNFLTTHQEPIVFFNSQNNKCGQSEFDETKNKTILIGPEGGFSSTEVASILEFSKIQEIHLPTPIMKAQTAVASSVGYLLAKGIGPK